MKTVEEKKEKLEKLRAARTKLDARIAEFVKRNTPDTQASAIRAKVKVPKELMDHARGGRAIQKKEDYLTMRIFDSALQRMQKAGTIKCNKDGAPYWELA